MNSLDSVHAVPGRGLEGDRYFSKTGTYSRRDGPDREITFIEVEAIEALGREYGIAVEAKETRRNVATRGIALNHLVGARFRVGEILVQGLRLCEPCGYLEDTSDRPIRAGLVHRGGLRAQILVEGWLRVGDQIVPIG